MIPDAAVEAALDAFYLGSAPVHPHDTEFMRAALEAALPILLSHEREETRLAHLDAVVNAATVDRLERELARAKADVSELKFLRGERKSLLKHLASWESQEHGTIGIDFLRRHLSKKQKPK